MVSTRRCAVRPAPQGHHRPLRWPSRSIHPIRVKSQPLNQRRLCHRNRRGTISVTRKKFKALVWRRNSSRRAIIHYGTSCATTASADFISILRQFRTVINLLENNEHITTKEEQDNIFFRPQFWETCQQNFAVK